MLDLSIASQHFMEPEGSVPKSQELSTCSYPEPDQSNPHHPTPAVTLRIRNYKFVMESQNTVIDLNIRVLVLMHR
jgi:hypothetical protein